MISRDKILGIGFICLAFSISFWISCSSTEKPEQPETFKDDPSFSQDIQPVFSASCALSGCHDDTASADLNLLQGKSYNNLVNIKSTQEPDKIRVIPNDAANSYLVIKIEGRQSAGERMPKGGSPLSSAKIQNIKNWINKGAKNN